MSLAVTQAKGVNEMLTSLSNRLSRPGQTEEDMKEVDVELDTLAHLLGNVRHKVKGWIAADPELREKLNAISLAETRKIEVPNQPKN